MERTDLDALMTKADSNPDDIEAQIAAAWANDSYGSEADAIRYYDSAWALGVPADKRRRFMVGYGSTMRNVGRIDEAIALHRQAIVDYPGIAPHHAFLAPALHTAGEHDEAMSEALTALVLAGTENLDGYDRSLSYYRESLKDPPSRRRRHRTARQQKAIAGMMEHF